jgi:DNA polymerase-3 subunit gamma/tau
LTKREPSFVKIEKITLTVENNIQIEYIRHLLQDFILFLRQTLKNEYIEIELQVTNEEVVKVVPITGQDKFNALANKNANLMILKNTFNLDIDY